MKIVRVDWLDSYGFVDMWTFRDAAMPQPKKCTTVGYLVKKDENSTIVAQSVNDEEWGRIIVIPTVSIVKVTEVSYEK